MAEILSIFSMTDRKTAPAGADQILAGRFVTLDANGEAVYPGAGTKRGLYMVLEGTHEHIGDPTEFGGSSPYDSTNAEQLPAVKASNQIAIAYGVFRAEVGPEACDPTATFVVSNLCDVDADGRLIPAAGGDPVAKVEAVTTDASSNVTSLTIRTLG